VIEGAQVVGIIVLGVTDPTDGVLVLGMFVLLLVARLFGASVGCNVMVVGEGMGNGDGLPSTRTLVVVEGASPYEGGTDGCESGRCAGLLKAVCIVGPGEIEPGKTGNFVTIDSEVEGVDRLVGAKVGCRVGM
jgi:hypothetical protein